MTLCVENSWDVTGLSKCQRLLKHSPCDQVAVCSRPSLGTRLTGEGSQEPGQVVLVVRGIRTATCRRVHVQVEACIGTWCKITQATISTCDDQHTAGSQGQALRSAQAVSQEQTKERLATKECHCRREGGCREPTRDDQHHKAFLNTTRSGIAPGAMPNLPHT
jgi:hypothetical protein